MFHAEKQPDGSQHEISTLNDDELECKLMDGIKELIQEHPELAVKAAGEIGWRVEPANVSP